MSFWKSEIELVQKAMGFRFPAKIEFDRMDLSNEDAEKALLIQLADRNIVSDELVQRAFGYDPDMEKIRLNRETRERDNERMVHKAGPYYNPQLEDNLKKIALQTGIVTPSEVGLELSKKKSGQKNAMELKVPSSPVGGGNPPSSKTPGQPQQGRPKTSKDTQQRKTKQFAPQTGASIQIWSMKAQDEISDILNPYLLEFYQKKNMRSLSNSEYIEAENTKTKILLSLDPFSKITEETVLAKLNTINSIDSNMLLNKYFTLEKLLANEINRSLTSDETKYSKAYFYQMVYFPDEINTEGEK
jgi:hypothetical protein